MSHTVHTPLRARVWALIAALLVAFGVVLASASPALAHDGLVGTDPAADSTVDVLPPQLTLTFSAEVADDEGATVLEVTDAAGTMLTAGAPSVQDNVVTQPLAGEASGVITVKWKIVSSDGHPTSGEFAFTVTAAPAPTPTETTSPEPTVSENGPTAEPTPVATPEQVSSDSSSALPWLIAGVFALALVGGIVYLVVSRSRREKALSEQPKADAGDAPQPGSGPGADH